MVQLSTGDMLRAAKTSGTEMGNMVADVMARGDLVTDEIVIGLIREQLEADNGADGYIFDGFPRTLAQADALGELLSSMGENLDKVVEMQVDDDALVARSWPGRPAVLVVRSTTTTPSRSRRMGSAPTVGRPFPAPRG